MPGNITIRSAPAEAIREFFASRSFTRIAVIVDEHTLIDCYPSIEKILPDHQIIVIPSGENFKELDTCILIWQKLTDFNFDRHSLLVGLGGGVIGDMAGFCAATFKRGIQFLLMPTTLLSQADACIGGKTGIDFQSYKNHIGVFQEPSATIIVTDFIKTLPMRELRSGYAEIVKHSLISDKAMWDDICTRGLMDQLWEDLIERSVTFKISVITADPKDNGLRKILNFGHTIGHALESYLLSTANSIYHGEAIAVGMIAESYIASQKKMIGNHELAVITGYLMEIFGKLELPPTSFLMPLMLQDKKNKGGEILMALPDGIGKAVWDIPVSSEEIASALEYYTKF